MSFSRASSLRRRDGVVPGLLIGIGLAGTLDEVVLHQLLGWHHFYTGSTSRVGLISDGLFHIASTALLALGLWNLLAGRGMGARDPRRTWAGVLIGTGGFNLYDGTIQHKVLGLHQVREGASDQLPYDIGFIAVALVVLLAGVVLLRSGPRRLSSR